MNHAVIEPEMIEVEMRVWECECGQRVERDEEQGWPSCECGGVSYVVSRRTVEVEEAI